MTTGTPVPMRRPGSIAGFVVVLVLFGLAAAAVNAVYSFGMVFATDSCGSGSDASTAALCNTAVWGLLVLLPWAGLLAALLGAGIGGTVARRRGRSPWIALLPAVGAYLATVAVVYLTVFV